jgi:hypothetical protein
MREALGLLPQRDVQMMTPAGNHAADAGPSKADPALNTVGYERLQAAMMAQSRSAHEPNPAPRPSAADLAAAAIDEELPIALDGIRPPRQKRIVHDFVDPAEIAAKAEQQRQQRLRNMKIAISIVMILAVAALLVGLLWKVGVFHQLTAAKSDSDQNESSKPVKVEAEQPPPDPETDDGINTDLSPPDQPPPTELPVKTIDQWLGDYEQAILLLNSDSLEELQKARAVILAVAKAVTDDRRPPDIDEALARINRRIEQVRLRELIDDGK